MHYLNTNYLKAEVLGLRWTYAMFQWNSEMSKYDMLYSTDESELVN